MSLIKRQKFSNSSTIGNSRSPSKGKKNTRVSFAKSIEETHIFDGKNVRIRSDEVRPTKITRKGILKQSPSSAMAPNEKREEDTKLNATVLSKSTDKKRPKKQGGTKQNKAALGVKRPINKKLRTVKIRRSTKEILMGLTKKERREFIRQLEAKNKPNYELIRSAKLLWEFVRNTKTAEDKREQSIQELLRLCTGKLAKLVYSHTTCRIVQCLVGLKKPAIREQIFDELSPEILRMAKTKYANYLVSKMLKYGSKNQRDVVINAFHSHCMDLYRVSCSANVLEDVYNEWATAEQRHSIVAEFYGNEFNFFKNEQNLPNSQLNIAVISNKHPEKMTSIVQSLGKLLEKVVLKIPMLKLSLTHKLLFDYLTHCSSEQRQSMIDSLKDQLPEICHSIEGSRAALLCLWNADVCQREAIVKSFHGLALRSCQDEYARRVLFGIFDTVDDTELVNEVITSEISNNIADLVFHKFGVWVFHYLVHPRDHRVFGKGLCHLLKQGDSNPYSDKLAKSRYREFFVCVRDNLLAFIKTNMREMLSNKISSVLVLDTLEVPTPADPFFREICDADLGSLVPQQIMKLVHCSLWLPYICACALDITPPANSDTCSPGIYDCFRAIAVIASDEFVPHSPDGPSHIVQGGCARFVFRKLLQADTLRRDGHRLSDFLADIPAESLSSWTGMDCGCYTLVEMYKSGSDKARHALRRAISVRMLQKSHLTGAKTLMDLLLEKNDDGHSDDAAVNCSSTEAETNEIMTSVSKTYKPKPKQ